MSKITELTLATILGVDDRFLVTKDTSGAKSDEQIAPEVIRQFMLMTGAEIKAAYEAMADTNAYTDAEKTKLAGIEPGATADMTDAEIKTAYENNADTNAFTDAEKAKLADLINNYKGHYATEAALAAAHPSPAPGSYASVESTDTIWIWDNDTSAWVDTDSSNIGDMLKSVYDPNNKNADAFDMGNMAESTTAKVMTDTERTKLAGIEDNATADMTGAEIKSAYEAEADTNAYTDADKLIVDGSKNYAKKMAIIFG